MATRVFQLWRQDRQRLEEMPELLVLLILQWHVQRCATKLRLDEPLQLVWLDQLDGHTLIDDR